VSYLLSGLFARACKSLGSVGASDGSDAIMAEVSQLRGLLGAKLAQINGNLDGARVCMCVRACVRASGAARGVVCWSGFAGAA
jgi:hypothetical protein